MCLHSNFRHSHHQKFWNHDLHHHCHNFGLLSTSEAPICHINSLLTKVFTLTQEWKRPSHQQRRCSWFQFHLASLWEELGENWKRKKRYLKKKEKAIRKERKGNWKRKRGQLKLSSPPPLVSPGKDWCLQIGGSSTLGRWWGWEVDRKMEFLIPHSIAPDRWGRSRETH